VGEKRDRPRLLSRSALAAAMSRRKVPPAVPTDVLVLGCASVGKTMLIRQLHGTPRCFACLTKPTL
jgi:hypothetical protein